MVLKFFRIDNFPGWFKINRIYVLHIFSQSSLPELLTIDRYDNELMEDNLVKEEYLTPKENNVENGKFLSVKI